MSSITIPDAIIENIVDALLTPPVPKVGETATYSTCICRGVNSQAYLEVLSMCDPTLISDKITSDVSLKRTDRFVFLDYTANVVTLFMFSINEAYLKINSIVHHIPHLKEVEVALTAFKVARKSDLYLWQVDTVSKPKISKDAADSIVNVDVYVLTSWWKILSGDTSTIVGIFATHSLKGDLNLSFHTYQASVFVKKVDVEKSKPPTIAPKLVQGIIDIINLPRADHDDCFESVIWIVDNSHSQAIVDMLNDALPSIFAQRSIFLFRQGMRFFHFSYATNTVTIFNIKRGEHNDIWIVGDTFYIPHLQKLCDVFSTEVHHSIVSRNTSIKGETPHISKELADLLESTNDNVILKWWKTINGDLIANLSVAVVFRDKSYLTIAFVVPGCTINRVCIIEEPIHPKEVEESKKVETSEEKFVRCVSWTLMKGICTRVQAIGCDVYWVGDDDVLADKDVTSLLTSSLDGLICKDGEGYLYFRKSDGYLISFTLCHSDTKYLRMTGAVERVIEHPKECIDLLSVVSMALNDKCTVSLDDPKSVSRECVKEVISLAPIILTKLWNVIGCGDKGCVTSSYSYLGEWDHKGNEEDVATFYITPIGAAPITTSIDFISAKGVARHQMTIPQDTMMDNLVKILEEHSEGRVVSTVLEDATGIPDLLDILGIYRVLKVRLAGNIVMRNDHYKYFRVSDGIVISFNISNLNAQVIVTGLATKYPFLQDTKFLMEVVEMVRKNNSIEYYRQHNISNTADLYRAIIDLPRMEFWKLWCDVNGVPDEECDIYATTFMLRLAVVYQTKTMRTTYTFEFGGDGVSLWVTVTKENLGIPLGDGLVLKPLNVPVAQPSTPKDTLQENEDWRVTILKTLISDDTCEAIINKVVKSLAGISIILGLYPETLVNVTKEKELVTYLARTIGSDGDDTVKIRKMILAMIIEMNSN